MKSQRKIFSYGFLFTFCAASLTAAVNDSTSSAMLRDSAASAVLTAEFISNSCPQLKKNSAAVLAEVIGDSAKEYSVQPQLLFALMFRESSCRLRATSNRGAMGLMQIMPATARDLGLQNPYGMKENVRAGAKYVSELLRQFDGNLYLAVAAYNAGPNAVRKYGKIPPYKETRNYVRAVLKHYYSMNEELAV